MAPQQKTGENFENKSQSDDVRRNNIIAAKGQLPLHVLSARTLPLSPFQRWPVHAATRNCCAL
jgi:hypothetical protein